MIDDNDRALVTVVRDAERKKMLVSAANPGAQTNRRRLLPRNQGSLQIEPARLNPRSGCNLTFPRTCKESLSFVSMTVRAGGGGGDAVTDGYVPTIGRDGLKHRFCVETAKVCGTDRWPPAVKAEL